MNPVELHPHEPAFAAALDTQAERLVIRRPAPTRLRALFEGRAWNWVRPASDALGLALAVVVTANWPGDPVPGDAMLVAAVLFAPVTMALLAARGMYQRRLRPTALDGVAPVLGSVAIAAMVVAIASTYLGSRELQLGVLGHLFLLGAGFVGAGRVGWLQAQRWARRQALVLRPTLVVGAGEIGTRVARRLLEHPEYGLHPVGFLDADAPVLADGGRRPVPILGGPDDLEWIAQLAGAEHVVIAFSRERDADLRDLVRRCDEQDLEVSLVPRFFEDLNHRTTYEALGGLPLQGLKRVSPHGRAFAVKHVLDRALAGVALVALAPLLLLLAAAIKVTSRGPVLFRQRRVGRDGQVFDLLKFRSMRTDDPARSFVPAAGSAPGGVEGVDRRTRIGRFIRRTSLDELPQLLNVLRGEMSLVGPRPERPEYVERFEADIRRYGERHRVKAGITGWAQVHGLRGQTSLSDRVEWDNFYIEHWSLGLDAKVLALTALAVLRSAE
jgi:exopolysaccharide biosynthesis polyprenyl glycosylphosphotransferase